MIFRVNKTKDFSVISNYHLQDKNLSLRAKGLLSLMLSLPDDWKFSIPGLASLCVEKEQAVKSSLDELKAAGYVVVTKLLPNQTASKRIEWLYDVYEKPQTEDLEEEQSPVEQPPVTQGVVTQGVVEQGIESQGIENQPLQNTKELSTKLQNTKEQNTKNKKERKKAESTMATFNEILDSSDLTKNNPELREAIVDFIKMRQRKKNPLTDRALKENINDAFKLAQGDPKMMTDLFVQSIKNGWQGIWELKDNTAPSPRTTQQKSNNPYTDMLRAEGYYD